MKRLPWLILCGSLLLFAFAAVSGWRGSIIDMHGFRQTQTALTVVSLLKGGPWFAYQTPVLGPPWAIPFELPLYQWLVALLVKAGVAPVEQAGRAVSVFFFVAALYPLFRILKALDVSEGHALLVLGMLCCSPQYLFWSRTFMIESTALSLSVYYLWAVVVLIRTESAGKRSWPARIAVAVVGAVAGMVKVTTFYAFGVAAILLAAWNWYRSSRENGLRREQLVRLAGIACCALIVPLAAVLGWTAFCDGIKSASPLGKALTSGALHSWTFGPFAQRLSADTWRVYLGRTVPDMVGGVWPAVVLAVAAFFCSRKAQLLCLACAALFLLPMLTFTNLYVIHNYYAYANGIFLILAAATVCADLIESCAAGRRTAGVLVLVCCLGFSLYRYLGTYYPAQGAVADYSVVQQDMNRVTAESDVLIVFGDDWSPQLPYYLNRRAVAFASNDLTSRSFLETRSSLAGYRIGAVAFVGDIKNDAGFVRSALAAFGMRQLRADYGMMDIYYNM